ncbi:methyltransferase domain-containing protein [Allostella humosa]|nr:methyltransferase domain-containing protein [Stella humosa]
MTDTPSPVATPTRLNIGSGRLWDEASINIDISPAAGPDILADLSRRDLVGMRFATHRFGTVELAAGAFDHITASHVLEHVPDLVGLMTNCLALLQDGGIMAIAVPYDLSYGAWQDPTHLRGFNERSWLYYTEWFWQIGWTEARFDLVDQQLVLSRLGQSLLKGGATEDELRARPRAVDEVRVQLRKRPLTDADRAAGDAAAHPHLERFPELARPALARAPLGSAGDDRYLDLLAAWLGEAAPGHDLGGLRLAAGGALDGTLAGDFVAAGTDAAIIGAMLAGLRRSADTTGRSWIATEGPEADARQCLERFHAMDDRVSLLAGAYGDSLPLAPVHRIALLAIGGGSEVAARILPFLFDRMPEGGIILVETAGRDALDHFLGRRAIAAPAPAESGGWICWRKARPIA